MPKRDGTAGFNLATGRMPDASAPADDTLGAFNASADRRKSQLNPASLTRVGLPLPQASHDVSGLRRVANPMTKVARPVTRKVSR